MKTTHIFIFLFFISQYSFGQLLPGTLDVTGFPSMSQSINDLVDEAGEDDASYGFESVFDASQISFILDPYTNPITGFTTSSNQNCTANIYRYSVYMHTQNPPQNTVVQAKTTFNSGVRFPAAIPYDDLIIRPLGPRDLTPENGGAYITIPNQGNVAIKVFEFIGCREQIPIQFKINPSALAISGNSNFNVIYTVVGSLN
ncbi:hypothetical protein [Reichenbachiella sp. MALMAid0571]|uniref:hypothetical protein n=1 Tax=Reichenbachiella sp. MALMAid0571 TaxID=3143939 RepID=UPI0032DF2FB2